MSFLTERVGRLLFALPFGIFGILHFMMADNMTGAVPDFIPGGVVWVYMTGIALLAACVSFVIQKEVRLAALLLALMLLIFAFTVHLPGVMSGSETSMPSLLKDVALAGGALILAGKYGDDSVPE
jgi:uncharacterized membrane protein